MKTPIRVGQTWDVRGTLCEVVARISEPTPSWWAVRWQGTDTGALLADGDIRAGRLVDYQRREPDMTKHSRDVTFPWSVRVMQSITVTARVSLASDGETDVDDLRVVDEDGKAVCLECDPAVLYEVEQAAIHHAARAEADAAEDAAQAKAEAILEGG